MLKCPGANIMLIHLQSKEKAAHTIKSDRLELELRFFTGIPSFFLCLLTLLFLSSPSLLCHDFTERLHHHSFTFHLNQSRHTLHVMIVVVVLLSVILSITESPMKVTNEHSLTSSLHHTCKHGIHLYIVTIINFKNV